MLATALKFLEPPLGFADKTRVAFYKSVKPLGRFLVGRKEARLAAFATAHLLIALFCAYAAPLLLIAWSVLILGAPHILMDIRHLVLRRGLHKRVIFFAVMIPTLVLAVLFGGIAATLAGAIPICLLSQAAPLKKTAVSFVVGMLAVVAWQNGPLSDFVFLYLHNVVGVILWWGWIKRKQHWHVVPLVLFFAVSLALLLFPMTEFFLHAGFVDSALNTMTAYQIAATFIPTPDSPKAAALLTLFAFTQSAHYAAWFYLIPEEDRPGTSPQGFAKSYQSLLRDCGTVLVFITGLLTICFITWGVFDLAGARLNYLRFAGFHGYLEVLVMTLMLTEGRQRAFERVA